MPATASAMIFSAWQDNFEIALRFKGAWERVQKTRPAGAGVEFRFRKEERKEARGANEGSWALLGVEWTRTAALSMMLEQHLISCFGKKLPPLCFRFHERFECTLRCFAHRNSLIKHLRNLVRAIGSSLLHDGIGLWVSTQESVYSRTK